ncbi:MAG: hypothetical protein HZA28_06490 [Candidatus Omnitrophica bacterium]|nr:hypothetical protein [Candidatus Omnitrophota bacterium]
MKSKIAEDKYAKTVKACREMGPEQRLAAFLHHSQAMAKLHQAGARFRDRGGNRRHP